MMKAKTFSSLGGFIWTGAFASTGVLTGALAFFSAFPEDALAAEGLAAVERTEDASAPRPQWKERTVRQWESVLKAGLEKNAPSIPEQWYAAYALGEYGAEAVSAVPVMLERLAYDAGKDDDVRACLLFSLGKIGAVAAFPAALEAFESEYPIIERTAALTLGAFPEKLKSDGASAIEKMERILEERSALQIPLAGNCATTLWGVGERGAVASWLSASLFSEREDAFTRNFEIYQALSVVQQLASQYGTDGLSDLTLPEGLSLPEGLIAIVQNSDDLDARLNASEALERLGDASVEPLRSFFEEKASQDSVGKVAGKLLEVLARLDAGNEATQSLILETIGDGKKKEAFRVSAIRSTQFLPVERRADAIAALVGLLNDTEIAGPIVIEARLALKKLQSRESLD